MRQATGASAATGSQRDRLFCGLSRLLIAVVGISASLRAYVPIEKRSCKREVEKDDVVGGISGAAADSHVRFSEQLLAWREPLEWG